MTGSPGWLGLKARTPNDAGSSCRCCPAVTGRPIQRTAKLQPNCPWPNCALDAGNDPERCQPLDKRRTLPDRLVVEDHAADAVLQTGRGDNQFAPGSPRRLGLGDTSGSK